MQRYQCAHLQGVSPEAFRRQLEAFKELHDAGMEDFKDPSKQRDMSVRFQWGHHHDFGDFQLEGPLKERHIWLLQTFIDEFQEMPLDLSGQRVLDVGCWTGGTSLLLCAMGAEVVAIEEVRKYADAVRYLKKAFGLDRLQVEAMSLFDIPTFADRERFDYVLYAGVLSHVTDPILSFRILFNAMKDGGKCLVETATVKSRDSILTYGGPTAVKSGSASEMNRSGWNWFLPSPSTLKQMMLDVGFGPVLQNGITKHRAFAVGTRKIQVDMMRGGLSVRSMP